MRNCYMLVGLPACGKSTYLNFLDDPNFSETVFVYSTDRVVEQVAKEKGKTYSQVFERTIKSATQRMEDMLPVAINMGVDIYWDQTNLTIKKRNRVITLMKASNYSVHCVAFLPPSNNKDREIWKTRLSNREGKDIPEYIINNMESTYVLPTLLEGYNSLTFLDMYGKEM